MIERPRTRDGWIRPPRWQPEDPVAIVAPAGPVPRRAFERGVAELRRLGLRPRWREDLFDRDGDWAGADERRAAEWREAWEDEALRGVVAARGGTGTARLLPLGGLDDLSRRARAFSGFSDLTFAHLEIQRRRLVSFYGPMVAWDLAGDRRSGGYDRALFERLLLAGEPGGTLAPGGVRALRPGRAEGRLAGGCLSLLAAAAGTPQALDAEGAVLVLEDEQEAPHRIDRYLQQLRRSGALSGVRAVVLGEFPGSRATRRSGMRAAEVFERFFADFPGPVLADLPIGHTRRASLTIPLGTRARVDAGGGTLELLEPAVA